MSLDLAHLNDSLAEDVFCFLLPSIILRISNDYIILASCLIWVDEFLDVNLKKAKDIEMAVVEPRREKKVFALKIKW